MARLAIEESIVRTVASRLVEKASSARRIVACAPPEYLPLHIARAALRFLGDDFVEVSADAVIADPEAVVSAGEPLVVVTPEGGQGAVLAALRPFPDVVAVVVIESDEAASPTEYADLIIGPQDLWLREDDIVAVHDFADGVEEIDTCLRLTGGVPALVALANEGDYRDAVVEACRDWAGRVHEWVFSDPVLELYAWVGPVASETVQVLAMEHSGSVVFGEDISAVESTSVLVRADRVGVFMPGALAEALLRRLERTDPDRHVETREKLTSVVSATLSMAGLERLKILTHFRAWSAVNAVLATRQHLLACLTYDERADLAARWPAQALHGLTHLEHARRFVAGEVSVEDESSVIPAGAALMGYLLSGEVPPRPGSTVGTVREWCDRLMNWGVPATRRGYAEFVERLAEVLLARTRQMEANPSMVKRDDAAFVAAMLVHLSDAALLCGEITLAQTCVQAATRAEGILGPSVRLYTTLSASILARSALVAAKSGLPRVTQGLLRTFDRAGEQAVQGRQSARASLARRMSSNNRGALLADPTVRVIDVEDDMAPQWAEVEAQRIAILHGQGAATEWLRTLLNRAAWTGRPEWEWWPVHSCLALLDVQAGRIGLAESRLGKGLLPPALDVTIRAAIEEASGRRDAALVLVDQVLRLEDVSHRWWLLATGVKLACLAEDPDRTGEAQMLLATEAWADVLGIVVLFPDRARARICQILGPGVDGFLGMAVAEQTSPSSDVNLTPRQLEVLRALATGDTMSAIAKRMFISVETVRSTAKEMYRRLGVHDRASAIQVGQMLGLVERR